MEYCEYYQATVSRRECWFFVAVLHSYEHLSFDRTIDIENSIFEFFVPQATEHHFLEAMEQFKERGMITDFKKMPNRLADASQGVWGAVNQQ